MSATILPPKENKIEQHNFKQYREAQDWLRSNRFKFKGYVDDERKEFFVERWEKDGLVALTMDITPFWNKLPLEILDKPYQIDIATF